MKEGGGGLAVWCPRRIVVEFSGMVSGKGGLWDEGGGGDLAVLCQRRIVVEFSGMVSGKGGSWDEGGGGGGVSSIGVREGLL